MKISHEVYGWNYLEEGKVKNQDCDGWTAERRHRDRKDAHVLLQEHASWTQ